MSDAPVRRAVQGRACDESGMTTAEYAVGTLGAVTIAAILMQVGASSWFRDLIRTVVTAIPELTPFFGDRVWILGG